MTHALYLKCFLIATLGILFALGVKMKGIKDKADAANVIFHPIDYIKTDWLSIFLSFLTVIIVLFFNDDLIGWQPALMKFITIFYGFIGFTGSTILVAFFSVVSKRVNAAIDYKTNIADTATGNMAAPTPAVHPKQ